MKRWRPILNLSFQTLFDYVNRRPDGYIRLVKAAETNEDLFRIAYMSEKYGTIAEEDIIKAGLLRDYNIWCHFQNRKIYL